MRKKMMMLIALAAAFAMLLSGCGTPESAAPTGKQTVAATLEEEAITLDTKIDVSKGYSVVFYRDGFSMFEGEYDDNTYPLVTATMISNEVYDYYIDHNKDRESYQEDDGVIKFISENKERCYLLMIENKAPFFISFEEKVDEAGAEEIMSGIEFELRQ